MKYIDPYLFFDENRINEKPIFVEVGSISGTHGMNLKKYYTESTVIIYEASQKSFKSLCERVKGKNITIHNKVVAGECGTKTFYEYNHCSSNSIYNREGGNKIITNKYEIDCINIFEILNENNIDYIDVLFLNCEGSELEILQSYLNDKEMHNKIKQISVSFHPQIYGKEIMQEMIEKINIAGFDIITDKGKYNNYLIIKK